MLQPSKKPVLLMVDDDDEDIYLTRRAFCDYRKDLTFNSVRSGVAMFDYLHCRGEYENDPAHCFPNVILMDINIPKENGFELLIQLHESRFAHLPVVVQTTSAATCDIQKAYQLGASSYICKSDTSHGIKNVAKHFCDYWFDVAKLPIAS